MSNLGSPLLRFLLVAVALVPSASAVGHAQPPAPWLDAYRDPASRLIGAAMADHAGWRRLAEVTDTFGPRLSGTPALDRAIAWAADAMRRDGLVNVRTEPATVPRWVRGRESLEQVEPAPRPLTMLGLGGSVATPADGLEAEAIVVSTFSELEARASEVQGRIVLFNVPFTGYGETVQYRTNGASRASRHGAVAALVRAVGPMGLRTPHTGALRYTEGVREIPAAAIAAEDADALGRLAARGVRIRLRLRMEAQFLPDAPSANVVGEIRGRERPDEVVVIGGHFDSWDVGTGASDDAVGCIITWEAARLLKQLGLTPRRTVRVVLFTNEENGLGGGTAYRDTHRDELAKHVMMLESDSGVFSPLSIGFSGSDRGRDTVRQIMTLLGGLGVDRLSPQGGGADIGPSVEAANIPSLSLNGNPDRYFQIHHTPADTVERIDPVEVARASAAVAVLTYVIADLPERLGLNGETATGAR